MEGDYSVFVYSSLLSLFCGLIFKVSTRKTKLQFSPKEGFAIVTFGWIFLSLFGCLPFVLADFPNNPFTFTNAFFEAMSGFSTTGATILKDIESIPKPLLFWRSLMHWVGGMGVVVLFLAILPALGAGGFQLFRAEIPGPTKDKLSPKIGNTAKTLWSIYIFLSLTCFIALLSAGMSPFNAVCHAFSTIATGGFSTLNDSVAGFNNWKIEVIIIFFMLISGCNFIFFLHILHGRIFKVAKNEELRFYFFAISISVVLIAAMVLNHSESDHHIEVIRDVIFQVICIVTTTGFATADFDLWPFASQFLLVLLMIMGGCAGSTSGGMKVFRVLVSIKVGKREVSQLLNPRAVIPLRNDGEFVSDALTHVIIGFVSIYFLILGASGFLVVWIEGDQYSLTSLLSICVSCLSNVGPGLDSFGPTDNYHSLKDQTKWLLSFLMLLGRLELYSVLVIFLPQMWRK
jgi:trk system potassium uptake protein TrkH